MHRRTRLDDRLLDSGDDVQVVPVSRWKTVPFLLVAITLLAYALYTGRDELLVAAYGAKALIVQSFTSKNVAQIPKQTQTSVVLPTVSKKDRLQTSTAEPNAPRQDPVKYKGSDKPKVITTIKLGNNQTMEIIDEPVPEDCYAEQHGDYDGFAVQWGLGHKARSAAECCRMCKEFKPGQIENKCNVWVWCGDPSGVCWTMDIHNHTTGDCWLKWQSGWDNNVDHKTTNLKVNHRGRYSEAFRKEHKTAPEFVPWVAGLNPTSGPKTAAASGAATASKGATAGSKASVAKGVAAASSASSASAKAAGQAAGKPSGA